MHPEGCTGSDCSFIYKWADNKDSTDFEITALLREKVSIDSSWIAIGEFLHGILSNFYASNFLLKVLDITEKW